MNFLGSLAGALGNAFFAFTKAVRRRLAQRLHILFHAPGGFAALTRNDAGQQ